MPESLSNAITVARSDGVLVVKRKAGAEERNQPTDEQLDDTPNADGLVDTYKKLPNDDPKAIEWRRKLGTMIIEELSTLDPTAEKLKERLDGGPGASNYHLSALPDGYVLWQHTKYFKDGATSNGKKLNHAAGGNDRQDAYLYGHPAGRKKRFRSPREFLPHLLWLALDDDGGQSQCVCKLCTPSRAAAAIKPAAASTQTPVRIAAAALAATPTAASAPATAPSARPVASTASQPVSTSVPPAGTSASLPADVVFTDAPVGYSGYDAASQSLYEQYAMQPQLQHQLQMQYPTDQQRQQQHQQQNQQPQSQYQQHQQGENYFMQ